MCATDLDHAEQSVRADSHTVRLALYGVFGVALFAFMFMPREWSATARYATWGIGALAGAVYTWLNHTESRREKVVTQEWKRRYDALVEHHDMPDDGHLYEWFDSAQWSRIFEALEGMPLGQRSLRRAIKVVDSSFLE